MEKPSSFFVQPVSHPVGRFFFPHQDIQGRLPPQEVIVYDRGILDLYLAANHPDGLPQMANSPSEPAILLRFA